LPILGASLVKFPYRDVWLTKDEQPVQLPFCDGKTQCDLPGILKGEEKRGSEQCL
jgi:hypothetical protein